MKICKIGLPIISLMLVFVDASHALNVYTHKMMNMEVARVRTADGFLLGEYLNDKLGFTKGLLEAIGDASLNKTQYVSYWLRDGAEYEDFPPQIIPYVRSVNHFHNPLKPIDEAGFSGIWGSGTLAGKSAVLWSQSATGTQSPGGHYAWADVRSYYYDALAAEEKIARDGAFAHMFRGLGQLLHLIQDMSVPEHARDDGHYLGEQYEDYIVKLQSQESELFDNALKSPIFYSMSGLTQLESPIEKAPVPVTNLFDTFQFAGLNPDPKITTDYLTVVSTPTGTIRSDLIGLAEYTNANFVSADTLFSRSFPYPSQDTSVAVVDITIPDPLYPNGTIQRKYFYKIADGDADYLLAGIGFSRFYASINDMPWNPTKVLAPMDDIVHANYAERLLPRAVGYSAALINYFFRGQLGITFVPGGVKVENLNDEVMTYYDDPDTGKRIGSIEVLYDDKDGYRHHLASCDLATTPTITMIHSGDESALIAFDSPEDNVLPGRYIVVFRGRLGNEDGAVIGRIYTPTVYYIAKRADRERIMRVSVGGGVPSVVYDTSDPRMQLLRFSLSPENNAIVMAIKTPASTYNATIVHLDLVTGVTTTVTEGNWPSWSPDGGRIVFSRELGRAYEGADEQLLIRDIETGMEMQLTDSVYAAQMHPAWSPVGSAIAFTSSKQYASGCTNDFIIEVMGVDRADRQSVSCSPDRDLNDPPLPPSDPLSIRNPDDRYPTWSGDGGSIVFSRYVNASGYYNLYHVDLGTGIIKKVTTENPLYDETASAWSPEGNYLAVESMRSGNYDIWLIDPKTGSYLFNLTSDNADLDVAPVFGR